MHDPEQGRSLLHTAIMRGDGATVQKITPPTLSGELHLACTETISYELSVFSRNELMQLLLTQLEHVSIVNRQPVLSVSPV